MQLALIFYVYTSDVYGGGDGGDMTIALLTNLSYKRLTFIISKIIFTDTLIISNISFSSKLFFVSEQFGIYIYKIEISLIYVINSIIDKQYGYRQSFNRKNRQLCKY